MRIVYCAIDQRVPGTTGGSTHVAAVAEGLAALGHDVHVLTSPGDRPFPPGRVSWHALGPPLGVSRLRFARAPQVLTMAGRLRPDAIIERYHNFGGEGLRAARRVGAVAVLEVNAPVIDYRGSPKRLLDRALLVQPMQRWRDWQCRAADLVVTPCRAIVPSWLPRDRVVEIEWGADTELFRPGAPGPRPFVREPGDVIAVFAGAFRRWHGAIGLVEAIRRMRARGDRRLKAVLIGEGPELPRARRAAGDDPGITFTGPVGHDLVPAALAGADIGVAPFDVAAHRPLELGFYWSPLKVFEYMASGLPVVAPAIEGLRRILSDGREGVLYDSTDPDGLPRAIERLFDPALRKELGAAARARVVHEFSWGAHCAKLDEVIRRARNRRTSR